MYIMNNIKGVGGIGLEPIFSEPKSDVLTYYTSLRYSLPSQVRNKNIKNLFNN